MRHAANVRPAATPAPARLRGAATRRGGKRGWPAAGLRHRARPGESRSPARNRVCSIVVLQHAAPGMALKGSAMVSQRSIAALQSAAHHDGPVEQRWLVRILLLGSEANFM